MLKKISKYIVVTFLFYVPWQLAAQGQTGFISVLADTGFSVYIDTTYAGNGTLPDLPFPAGEYTIHVFDTKSQDWSDRGSSKRITLDPGEHITVKFDPTEITRIESVPFGGSVYVNNVLIGITPLKIDRKTIENKQLTVRKNGFVTEKFNMGEADGEPVRLTLKPGSPSMQVESVILSDSDWQLKWYREGLVVTSLLSSWASFFFKREADETYRQYQMAAGSHEMNTLYNRTRHYDRLSDIAIVVSVATLSTYFYLLLTE